MNPQLLALLAALSRSQPQQGAMQNAMPQFPPMAQRQGGSWGSPPPPAPGPPQSGSKGMGGGGGGSGMLSGLLGFMPSGSGSGLSAAQSSNWANGFGGLFGGGAVAPAGGLT